MGSKALIEVTVVYDRDNRRLVGHSPVTAKRCEAAQKRQYGRCLGCQTIALPLTQPLLGIATAERRQPTLGLT
jgi:hypothetical protein